METDFVLSRSGTERVCFRLRQPESLARFKADPGGFLAGEDLSERERQAILAGEVGTLYAAGVSLGALELLCRAFGYDNETYVRQLREASGRGIRQDQIAVLRARAAARSKG